MWDLSGLTAGHGRPWAELFAPCRALCVGLSRRRVAATPTRGVGSGNWREGARARAGGARPARERHGLSPPPPPPPETLDPPVAASSPAPATSGLIWPLHGRVAQEFGHNGHPGIDIDAPY